MPKLCDAESCYNPRWGKGYCKYHQHLRTDKKPKAIRPIAIAREEDYKIYRPRRDKYMREHPNCEVKECNKPSQDLHHVNGRTNDRLYDVKYFMAICRKHHTKIDEDTVWAREEGYLV